ncbi:MAG TPA: triose-phosphate isomerase [Bacteroidia bacterium]|jgi:triosephosphate isomerase
MRRKIVAGNWKMNMTLAQGLQLVDDILAADPAPGNGLKIIAPPFIHLTAVAGKIKGREDFALAAQDCHHLASGAYTGEVSAAMIASTGAGYVILGHSERRLYAAETNELLAQKVNIALANNLVPIFCIGESIEERNANTHLEAVRAQIKESLFHLPAADFSKLVIAYEPVWAIGTGVTATSHQAQGVHNFIRQEINKKYGREVSENISIVYGGSCNPQNAPELFSCLDIDGGLIGGASLKANDFIAIYNSF